MNSKELEYSATMLRSAVTKLLISNLMSDRTDRVDAEKASNWILMKSKRTQKTELLTEYMRGCSEFKSWEKRGCNSREIVEMYYNKSVNYVVGCGFKKRIAEKRSRIFRL